MMMIIAIIIIEFNIVETNQFVNDIQRNIRKTYNYL